MLAWQISRRISEVISQPAQPNHEAGIAAANTRREFDCITGYTEFVSTAGAAVRVRTLAHHVADLDGLQALQQQTARDVEVLAPMRLGRRAVARPQQLHQPAV